jgi:hypothetical protein
MTTHPSKRHLTMTREELQALLARHETQVAAAREIGTTPDKLRSRLRTLGIFEPKWASATKGTTYTHAGNGMAAPNAAREARAYAGRRYHDMPMGKRRWVEKL